MSGRRTETESSSHELLPVGQYLRYRLWMIIRGIAWFIVGFHCRGGSGIVAIATIRYSGPTLIDVMRYTFTVIAGIFTQSERIAPGGVQNTGKFRHFQIFGVSYETSAVTVSSLAGGECDHVTSLQLKTAYFVVEFGIC